MYIYNVTCLVTNDIHEEWLAWMRAEHIPKVIATGLYSHHRILRLRDTDESDGVTYAIQYFCSSREAYDLYIARHATALRREVQEKWGESIVSFRTLMEVIN
jgi:hypothetical protein